MTTDGRAAAGRRSTTSGPPPNACAGSRSGRRSSPFGPPDARRYLKAESLQPIGAFKLRGAYVAVASLSPEALRARRHHLLVGQPRPGRRSRGPPARGARPSSSCRPTRRRIKRERVGRRRRRDRRRRHRQRRTAAGRRGDRRGARPGDHPAVRRRPDHRRPGHGRARDRRGPAGSGRRPRAGRRRRAGERRGDGHQGPPPGRPRHRRRAGAGGRRARLARTRRDRALAGRAGVADDRRRHADPGARARGPSRTCARTSTAIVTVSEAEIAAGVRLAAERSRLVVEPSGALGIAAMAFHARGARAGSGRRLGRGRGQRRQRRSRALPRIPGGADPARGLRSRRPVRRRRARLPAGRPVSPRSSARRSASRRSRIRICGQIPRLARPIRRAPRPAPRPASSRRRRARIAARKIASPAIHMIPAARRWSSSAVDPPRPDERRVVRIQHGRGVEDHDREERVLGHLHEHVADPGRVAHPPRRRVERDGRPPEQERARQEQHVLEVVDERVLERRVEQRREVGRPHQRREDRPRPRPGGRGSARRANAGPAGSSGGASRAS